MQWVYLAVAIALEVVGTLSLRVAALGRPVWYWVVAVGYVGSLAALSAGLAAGLNLGVGYGIWAAIGVALIAIASRFLFREPLTPVMTFGIVLLASGVLLVQV
ncbi:DMT family transporter, partial [Mycolicibacterium sp.]